MAYSEKVVEHYENPRNVGSFEKGDDTVGTGMVGAPACGDVMKLQIKVNPETGIIDAGLPGFKYKYNMWFALTANFDEKSCIFP